MTHGVYLYRKKFGVGVLPIVPCFLLFFAGCATTRFSSISVSSHELPPQPLSETEPQSARPLSATQLPATPLTPSSAPIPSPPINLDSTIVPSLNDLQKAYEELQKRPKDPKALIRYGELAIAIGRIPQGVRALLTAAQVAPHSKAPYVFLAHLYEDAGYTDLEMQALRHLVSLHTADPNVYLRLVAIYLQLHWLSYIPPLLHQVESLAPSRLDVLFWKAQYLFETGHTQRAIQLLQTLFQRTVQPKEINAFSPQSMTSSDPTINLEQVTFYLASYLTAAEQLSQAEQVVRTALQQLPSSARLQLLLAYTLERIGDPSTLQEALSLAQAALQSALSQKRADFIAEAYYREGKAYLLMNRSQEALMAFQKSYQTNPAFEDVAFQLGRLLLRNGHQGEGTKLIRFYEIIKNNSIRYGTARDVVNSRMNDPEAHLHMAQWYMRLGVFNDAVVEYKQTLSLRSSDEAAWEGLKKALLAMGRRTEADRLAVAHRG